MLQSPKPSTTEVPFVAGNKQERAVGKARRPRTGRILALAMALAAIVGAGVAAWDMFLRPVEIQAALAERDVPVQVFGLGTVEARVASKVGFKVPGVVVDLRADVGDYVARGVILARLDDREQQALVARAKAATEQAEANLQRALASIEKAQTNYANARSINARRQALLKGNTTSIEAAESAQAAEDAARADVSLAQSDVLVANANIGEAKAQEQQQSTILDFYTLAAPYDAMITARTKELGTALGIGEPVFTLVDPKTVWVLAYIDESKAGEIRLGELAEIVLRSRPTQHLPGRVIRIEPESDRVNEERKIEVAFDRIPDDFNLGEQAEAYITTVRLPQALLVPEAAILDVTRDRGMVWTVEDGRLEQRPVTLGHRLLDGRFEITGGVPDGASVVTELRGGMRVGRAAKPIEGQAP